MRKLKRNKNVFINCPFDHEYQFLEDVIVFTVIDCGFKPRSAKESSATTNRIIKIEKIIEECDYGIHDISRTDLDVKNKLPRFNMPLELGLFLGARRYGNKKHQRKECLIFDEDMWRYEKFISDLKGHDIVGHQKDPIKVICSIRNFLAEAIENQKIFSGKIIYNRYSVFSDWLQKNYYEADGDKREDLSFSKFSQVISEFLKLVNEEENKWH